MFGCFRKQKYKIEVQGRSGIIYREGAKYVRIHSEMECGEYDLFIDSESIEHWEPEGQVVTEEERKRILERLEKGFKGTKITWK